MIRDLSRLGMALLALGSVACGADEQYTSEVDVDPAARVADSTGEHLVELQQASTLEEVEALRAAIEQTNRSGVVLGPDSRLLAEIREEKGRTYFVETGAGIVIASVGKWGTRKELKSLSRELDAVEMYERLAPGQLAPVALRVAQERLDQALRDRPARDPRPALAERPVEVDATDHVLSETKAPSVEGELRQAAINDSACPGEEFEEENCDIGDYSYCRLWRTGTNTIAEADVDRGYTSACSYRGNVTHRVRGRPWSDWVGVIETTLAPGDDDWLRLRPYSWGDQDFEAKVFNSDGDGFHHAADIYD